jgi:hypothetical protein
LESEVNPSEISEGFDAPSVEHPQPVSAAAEEPHAAVAPSPSGSSPSALNPLNPPGVSPSSFSPLSLIPSPINPSPANTVPVNPAAVNPAAANPAAVNPAWLRLAYALEFFVAVIAIISLWSEVGGEGHLDLMPWYFKLGCIAGLAWCCVRFTAAIVEQQKVWAPRTLGWFAGILLFCIVMGGITYYYHLHEESDDGDDDTTSAAIDINNRGILFYEAGKRSDPSFPICFLARSSSTARD